MAFDNVDIHKDVRDMTESHQNIDQHYCAKMAVENRVSGNHLSTLPTGKSILDMDNAAFLPSREDHWEQRLNYISLVGRILCRMIPCLQHLPSVTHIKHQYSDEMSKPPQKVSFLMNQLSAKGSQPLVPLAY